MKKQLSSYPKYLINFKTMTALALSTLFMGPLATATSNDLLMRETSPQRTHTTGSKISSSQADLSSIEKRALTLKKISSFQDGPNCFNASLNTLGYKNQLLYTSDIEFSYYLKHHCRQIPFEKSKLLPTSILTYQSSAEYLDHSAVVLRNNQIIEKNSLYGSKHKTVLNDHNPGKYLIHGLDKSIFFARLSPNATMVKAYSCDSSQKVTTENAQLIQKNADLSKLIEMQNYLASLTALTDKATLTYLLNEKLVNKAQELNLAEIFARKSTIARVNHFKLGLMESIAYQWNLLNCSEAYAKYDECYAPENQRSIGALDFLYPLIFEYRKLVK